MNKDIIFIIIYIIGLTSAIKKSGQIFKEVSFYTNGPNYKAGIKDFLKGDLVI